MTKSQPSLPIAPLVPYIRHRERLIGGRQELAKRIHNELRITEACYTGPVHTLSG